MRGLARQGSPELRWALFEAAKAAGRHTSPDMTTAPRSAIDSAETPAAVSRRKLVRRCYQALRELGDQRSLRRLPRAMNLSPR